MDYTQFLNLTDSWKVFLVDAFPADEVEDLTWTQCASPNTAVWWAAYTVGPVTEVQEDGVKYTEAYSLVECQATASSFYFDLTNQKLYLHTSGGDSPGTQTVPGTYDYTILAISIRCIANTAYTDDPIVIPRITEALLDGDLEQWSDATTMVKWSKSLTGASTINRETTSPENGGFCLRIDIDGSNNLANFYQNLRMIPGGQATLTIWYKTTNNKDAAFLLADSGGNVYLHSDGTWGSVTGVGLTASTTWKKYELTFTAHASYTNYTLYIGMGGDWTTATSSSGYFDNISIGLVREENPYEPLISSQGMPDLHQAVSMFQEGAMVMEFGTIQFINDGWWYKQIQDYLWYLREIRIRYGAKGSTWTEFEDVFTGLMRAPVVNDLIASISVIDNKVFTYKMVPPTNFDVATYPNLEDNAEGRPIPIIYGEFSELVPTCIDITTYKYKVACHALEDIPEVWSNGVLLTITTDYTVDLANGEFTLLADPGDAFITCSVKGKKCSMLDGTYSENVADILYDLLVAYCDVDASMIDFKSFLELRNGRSQKHHVYLNQAQQALEIARLLTTSALFNFIPLQNGKLGAFKYSVGVDSSTPIMYDEDWKGFEIVIETASVYKGVKINYGLIPSESHFDSVGKELPQAGYRYRDLATLELISSLRLAADADNLADYYLAVIQAPAKKVKGTLPSILFAYRPGQKVIINKTRQLVNNTTYNVFSNEAYRLLDLKKKMQTGKVDVEAWEDLQSAGEGYCAVCYNCEVCVATQSGTCSSCYACESCVVGQCPTCQACYYCQSCNTGQCGSCQTCDTCQVCNACEVAYGGICQACQLCNTGQCSTCQDCISCERCYACQRESCGKTG